MTGKKTLPLIKEILRFASLPVGFTLNDSHGMVQPTAYNAPWQLHTSYNAVFGNPQAEQRRKTEWYFNCKSNTPRWTTQHLSFRRGGVFYPRGRISLLRPLPFIHEILIYSFQRSALERQSEAPLPDHYHPH
jgi:hypothetical protein